jgi:hypothetical protein
MTTLVDVAVFAPGRAAAAGPLTWREFSAAARAMRRVLGALQRSGGVRTFAAAGGALDTWRALVLCDLAQAEGDGDVLVCEDLAGSLAAAAAADPEARVLSRAALGPGLDRRRFAGWQFDRGALRLVRARPWRGPPDAPPPARAAETPWPDVPWPDRLPSANGAFERFALSAYEEDQRPLSKLRDCPEEARAEERDAAAPPPAAREPREDRARRYLNCRDCGYVFQLLDQERAWFRERKLKAPTRCGACRKAGKDAAAEKTAS